MAKKVKSISTKSVGKKKKKVKEPTYSLVLNHNDAVQKVKGDSVLEMIKKLKVPESMGTAASFLFKRGKTELTIILPSNKVLQFFRLPSRQELLCDLWQRQVDEAELEEIAKKKK